MDIEVIIFMSAHLLGHHKQISHKHINNNDINNENESIKYDVLLLLYICSK